MSANRLSFCPNCQAERTKAIEEANQKAAAAYGKVSNVEYLLLVRRIDALAHQPEGTTLAEYWELYLDKDTSLHVTYSARCSSCGWQKSFEYKERD